MLHILTANVPDIVLLSIFGADLFVLIFKPHLIEGIRTYWSIGPLSREYKKPASRFRFLCFGLLFGIAGLSVLLYNCGVITGGQVPLGFALGFAFAILGVIYDILK